MKIEFRGNEVAGNPFDVILQSAFAYTRAMLFNIMRYRGDTINPDWSDYLVERIRKQIEILDTMSKDEVELCRKNSVMYKHMNHNTVNNFLFSIEEAIPTIYSECNPEFGDEVESLLIGKESSDYLKRGAIIDLCDETIEKKCEKDIWKFNKFLNKCIDVLDDAVKKENKDKKAVEFVNEHELSIEDIGFMRSYTNHLINERTQKLDKLFGLMNEINL